MKGELSRQGNEGKDLQVSGSLRPVGTTARVGGAEVWGLGGLHLRLEGRQGLGELSVHAAGLGSHRWFKDAFRRERGRIRMN